MLGEYFSTSTTHRSEQVLGFVSLTKWARKVESGTAQDVASCLFGHRHVPTPDYLNSPPLSPIDSIAVSVLVEVLQLMQPYGAEWEEGQP